MPSPRFIDALGHGPSDKRIDILRGIASTGSISQAAREAGVSYKAAWQAIDTLTNLAGVPLVERAVGGAGGGGALLTAQGGHLLELADALDTARREVHARWSARGADAGAQADATMARLAVRTSMRNQLPATIDALTPFDRTVRVQMRLGTCGAMAARITQESVELLGLQAGMTVIALCKATAVRVERVDAAAQGGRRGATGNRLLGAVASALRGGGDSGDEIAVALEGGLQLVGFAPSGSGLRVRQRAAVVVDESAVVVALAG
ncbi:TOBE domain-containing protein [Variovorax sp. N23]|uniref:TOBE domain-containing protein n=1 Tax=Variovorax sp. N23 TaxID=2980555 RepID=UPI0021C78A52|nr:TOBE domain-containing protein [Variovorax sp. N23]MCU4117772.1 TOBE domain-containing protein [Variovorax sp. N23]